MTFHVIVRFCSCHFREWFSVDYVEFFYKNVLCKMCMVWTFEWPFLLKNVRVGATSKDIRRRRKSIDNSRSVEVWHLNNFLRGNEKVTKYWCNQRCPLQKGLRSMSQRSRNQKPIIQTPERETWSVVPIRN